MFKRLVPWTAQPQTLTRLNISHPFANRIVVLINGNYFFDVKNGRQTKKTGTINKVITPYGIGSAASVSAGVHSLSTPVTSLGTENLTDFVLVVGGTPGSIEYACGTYDGGSNGSAIFFNHTSAPGKWGAIDGNNTPSLVIISSTEALPTSGLHLLVHTRDNANHFFYRNGVLIATVAGKNVNTSTAAFCQNSLNTTGVFSSTIPILLSGRIRGALSANEVKFLYDNVWTLLAAQQRNVFTPQTAGIAFDAASNSGYQAASSSYTFNRTVSGTDRFLDISVSILSAGQTVTSIVDDFGGSAVAAVFVGAQNTVTSFGRVEKWRVIAPTLGTKSIQVNLSDVVISAAMATSYTGVNQTTPTEGFNSAQATNVGAADATVNITSVADNCWITVAVAADDGSVTANQTSRNNVTGAGGSGANEDSGPKTPAGSVTMSYTGVGALATWAIAGYAIRPVAAASATVVDLTAAALNLTPQSTQNTVAATLTAADLKLTPQSTQNTLGAALTASALNLTPQDVQNSTRNNLTAAAFDFVPLGITAANSATGTVIDLTAASLSFVANDTQNAVNVPLAVTTMDFVQNGVQSLLAQNLTACAFDFVGQDIQNTLGLLLENAIFDFVTRSITAGDPLAGSGRATNLMLMGVGN